jgi:plasmid stabilization system protein ParE
MVEIRWSPKVTDDYELIIEYNEKTAPKFAQSLAKKIVYIIENLNQFTKLGRIVPEIGKEETREVIYRNFCVIYRFNEGILEIARLIHGRFSPLIQ